MIVGIVRAARRRPAAKGRKVSTWRGSAARAARRVTDTLAGSACRVLRTREYRRARPDQPRSQGSSAFRLSRTRKIPTSRPGKPERQAAGLHSTRKRLGRACRVIQASMSAFASVAGSAGPLRCSAGNAGPVSRLLRCRGRFSVPSSPGRDVGILRVRAKTGRWTGVRPHGRRGDGPACDFVHASPRGLPAPVAARRLAATAPVPGPAAAVHEPPGLRARRHAVLDGELPVDDHLRDARRILVRLLEGRVVLDRLRVEDYDVRVVALLEQATIGQREVSARAARSGDVPRPQG